MGTITLDAWLCDVESYGTHIRGVGNIDTPNDLGQEHDLVATSSHNRLYVYMHLSATSRTIPTEPYYDMASHYINTT